LNKKFTGFLIAIVVLTTGWQVTRSFWTEEEKQLRSQIRSSFEQQFTDEIAQSKKRFGLKAFNPHSPDARHIILIHGLDDPGKVWMNLAPALARLNHNVWIMTYPNDQPIKESAFLFNEQLKQLKQEGISDISVIAHSMGGLVSREVLTNSQTLCKAKACTRSHIRQLIMVGTPNHGSELARFRSFAEFREQTERLIEGEARWLDWIADGAGEAGIDLLPKSQFLLELNQRPLPDNTDYFIIAGAVTDQEDIGDTLVSLDSAKLESVPFEVVSGNHLSMIRNISVSSRRIPPAIPVITKLLKSD
jgi:pimeloyl-ACP methyl ester carboxylesterase